MYCVLCTAYNSHYAHVVNYNAVDLNNNDRCVCTVYRAQIATRRNTTVRQQFSHEKYLFGIAKPTLIFSVWILVELPSRLYIFESFSPAKYGKNNVFSAQRSDPRLALMTASAENLWHILLCCRNKLLPSNTEPEKSNSNSNKTKQTKHS